MLFITLGDPYSVNIELLAPHLDQLGKNQSAVICGSYSIFRRQLEALGVPMPTLQKCTTVPAQSEPGLYFLDIGEGAAWDDWDMLRNDARLRGRVAVEALERIPRDFPRGLAVLTCPIDKYACSEAGFAFPGQTEFISYHWSAETVMILAGKRLRVGLVTNHLPLSQVAGAISTELIMAKAKCFHQSLRELYDLSEPTLGICGLNPHCGDQGLFGHEDEQIIAPAVRSLQKEGIRAIGPVPADTAFFRGFEGAFDGVLAMYHDQGLGPLKALHFYDAVNVTGGAKFLRVSPDHGPAADLFLKGIARGDSLTHALELCRAYLAKKG